MPRNSHLPQPPQRLHNPLDLLRAFGVLSTEVGGELFGGGGGSLADTHIFNQAIIEPGAAVGSALSATRKSLISLGDL